MPTDTVAASRKSTGMLKGDGIPRNTIGLLHRLGYVLMIGVILAGLGSAMLACYRRLAGGTLPAYPFPMLASLLLYLIYCCLNSYGWTRVLTLLGSPIEPSSGIRLWIKCEACRWIPGSIWNLGVRSVAATRLGVSLARSTSSLMVEMLLTICSWTVLASAATLLYRKAMWAGVQQLPPGPLSLPILVMFGLFALGTVVFGLARYRPGSGRNGKEVTHAIAQCRIQPGQTLRLLIYYASINALNGVALFSLLNAFPSDQPVPLFAVIGANAIAWLAGFLVLFAPGGIIVREATLTVVLACWIPGPLAFSIAMSWRMLQLIGEVLLLAGIGITENMVTDRRLRFPNRPQTDSTPS